MDSQGPTHIGGFPRLPGRAGRSRWPRRCRGHYECPASPRGSSSTTTTRNRLSATSSPSRRCSASAGCGRQSHTGSPRPEAQHACEAFAAQQLLGHRERLPARQLHLPVEENYRYQRGLARGCLEQRRPGRMEQAGRPAPPATGAPPAPPRQPCSPVLPAPAPCPGRECGSVNPHPR